ncbi:Avr1b-1 avirulence-like protein [Phytophthora sojae]|uniref:RxLR effector protein n=2 Tax=Phytophthora sojae TaxID=67593 RepID=G4YNH3_PHYSP|nr:Avr1b-1 avirulence-like protein [Phytophthora sojae]AEK80624.1 Avh81 [Phytophthora sojae]AEK80625.1 Avh81 [Phytophthora sojae]AEK80626.1 Avh81 [Phytophthora sojae]EGZ30372.1 Avr1b-1 avirulence-like protein [Phytophthora sojae]|eukprot:XP_009517647.1 Avr1b-1 avirulence-like protein [Phytophthora sojae]
MSLRCAALATIVATLFASCIAQSSATATVSDPASAIHSPNEAQHTGNRFLRTPVSAGGESEGDERGLDWFTSNAAKALKTQKAKWIKNAQIYDDLIMQKRTTRDVYTAWRELNASPEKIERAMAKVGYGGDDYKYIVDGYKNHLEYMKNVQLH